MKRIIICVIACLLAGCAGLEIYPSVTHCDSVFLTVELKGPVDTKSQYSPDETAIHDLNLYVFDSDGVLLVSRYDAGTSKSVTMELKSSEDYSVRAIANWGAELTFSDEAALVQWCCNWPDFQRSGFMVMTGSAEVTPVGSSVSVSILLQRIASKVTFMIDDSALGKVNVTSARLCQASRAMRPFTDGNKASSSADVMNGDYATTSDLAFLNAGGEMVFYVMENMQGTLLSGNLDPWNKVPDSIPLKSGLCTYVEVEGVLDGVSSIFSGNVMYRFYLGNDNCTNFDVKRNTDYSISLVMSTNLDAVSWKISTDAVVVDEGHGSGAIFNGRQFSLNDLYVGDLFEYGVDADAALMAYFGGDLSRAELILCDAGGNECSELEFGAIGLVDGKWISSVRCVQEISSQRSIWLYDAARGRRVQKLSSTVSSKCPRMAVELFIAPTGSLATSATALTLTLNGGSMTRYLCMVDESGHNICGRWFDNSLFRVTSSMTAVASEYDEVCGSVLGSFVMAANGSAYLGVFYYAVSYTGNPVSLGYKLSDLCSSSAEYVISNIRELNYGLVTQLPLRMECRPMTLDYDCSSLRVTLDNPSRLPLQVSYYDYTYFGPGNWNYDRVTNTAGVDYTYAEQGRVYSATRYDCVNHNSQCFGYSDVGTMEMVNGTYDLSGTLMDYFTAYSMFGDDNTSADGSAPVSYAVFDVRLKGLSGTIGIQPSSISTGAGSFDPGVSAGAAGSHGGVAIFSDGALVAASADVNGLSVSGVASACGGSAIIYSPQLLLSSLDGFATISSTSSVCASGQYSGSTEWLGLNLSGGCSTRFDMSYHQIAAIRTLPNGYGDNIFTTYSYYWQGPYMNTIVQTRANAGNNRLSYLYMPGTSTAQQVSGTYGSDKFTSSNYSYDSSLIGYYSGIIASSSGALAQLIPVKDFITEKVYSLTATDSAKSLGKSSTYSHRYHPGDCSIDGIAETTSPELFYRCNFGSLFSGEMSYFNSGYEGFYSWIWRDLSAPFTPTDIERYSAGSNCDKYTTWYFRNQSLDTENTLRTGACIHIHR